MKQICRRWTPTEIKQLRSLVGEGTPATEIAKVLCRSRKAVISKMFTLKIRSQLPCRINWKFDVKCPVLFAQVYKFRMAEWTCKQTAKALNICYTQVSRILTENGLKNRFNQTKPRSKQYRRWTDIEIASLRKALQRGIPIQQIHITHPHRTLYAVERKSAEITRYWLSDAEQAARKRLRKKQLRIW